MRVAPTIAAAAAAARGTTTTCGGRSGILVARSAPQLRRHFHHVRTACPLRAGQHRWRPRRPPCASPAAQVRRLHTEDDVIKAYKKLGLEPGASRDDAGIQKRRLNMKYHQDESMLETEKEKKRKDVSTIVSLSLP